MIVVGIRLLLIMIIVNNWLMTTEVIQNHLSVIWEGGILSIYEPPTIITVLFEIDKCGS